MSTFEGFVRPLERMTASYVQNSSVVESEAAARQPSTSFSAGLAYSPQASAASTQGAERSPALPPRQEQQSRNSPSVEGGLEGRHLQETSSAEAASKCPRNPKLILPLVPCAEHESSSHVEECSFLFAQKKRHMFAARERGDGMKVLHPAATQITHP